MNWDVYNNIWGTTFPMWFDDDMLFRFRISEGVLPSRPGTCPTRS